MSKPTSEDQRLILKYCRGEVLDAAEQVQIDAWRERARLDYEEFCVFDEYDHEDVPTFRYDRSWRAIKRHILWLRIKLRLQKIYHSVFNKIPQ